MDGIGAFSDCGHSRLRCEECGAVSGPFGWSAFTDRDELAAEVDRLKAVLSVYANQDNWRNGAELSVDGDPDKCIFWYRGQRGHGFEFAKAALAMEE